MSNIIIQKIELLEDQIENFERSGFFTEPDMDRLTHPLKMELEMNIKELNLYGMTLEDFKEGVRIHNTHFSKLKQVPNYITARY